MKKYIIGLIIVLGLFVSYSTIQAASFTTQGQINAVVEVLRAFNVDESKITRIVNILNEGNDGCYTGNKFSSITGKKCEAKASSPIKRSSQREKGTKHSMTNTLKKRISVKCMCGKEDVSEYEKKFWSEKISIRNDDNVVRINGNHYMLSKGPLKGFGGQKWKIEFDDGRIVETDNLWHQGNIPEDFRQVLPDNAKFIE